VGINCKWESRGDLRYLEAARLRIPFERKALLKKGVEYLIFKSIA
jgi:hypothetical protein